MYEESASSIAYRVADLQDILTGDLGVPRVSNDDREAGEAAIRETQDRFGVEIPEDYRAFLLDYGYLAYGEVGLLGLAPKRHPLSLPRALVLGRMSGGLPNDMIPVEALGGRVFACVVSGTDASPVFRVDPDAGEKHSLAPTFVDYVANRFASTSSLADRGPAFARLARHVEQFEATHCYDHADGGRLPKPHEWRPIRLCVQDVVLGALVLRHNRTKNNMQVDVFITEELAEYEPLEPARVATLFVLSEAYQAGGTLEVEFTDGLIPGGIQSLAKQKGVSLSRVAEGVLTSGESRLLYYRLTEFTPEVETRIDQLCEIGALTPEQAAYAIHHSTWTRHELEVILRTSDDPQSILTGAARPTDRLRYMRDVHQASLALWSGRLLTRLTLRNPGQEVVEDDLVPVAAKLLPEALCVAYSSEEQLCVPWLESAEQLQVRPGGALIVAPRPRSTADIASNWRRDLAAIESVALSNHAGQLARCLMYTSDCESLPDALRQELRQAAAQAGVRIMVGPDSLRTLSQAVDSRLLAGRTARKC